MGSNQTGGIMNARKLTIQLSILAAILFCGAQVARAQAMGNDMVAKSITQMENDAVKADLAGDTTWYEKHLADDWTGAQSMGKFYTKDEMLKLMSDKANNNYKSEKLSDLKVRVYGGTAVATYKDTYDATVEGKHRAVTILDTDTWAKIGGEWKEVASHACVESK
jgi:Domain of unknown function (DUF4440)